jgi:hypothetical protein
MPLEGFDDVDVPQNFGRPEAKLDLKVIARAASIGCSMEEIAAVAGVAPSTLYLHREKHPEVAEAIESGKAMGRATLRRLQWQGAQDGNATMLVWLGKQLLDQKDNIGLTGEDGGAIINEVIYRWNDPKQIEGKAE